MLPCSFSYSCARLLALATAPLLPGSCSTTHTHAPDSRLLLLSGPCSFIGKLELIVTWVPIQLHQRSLLFCWSSPPSSYFLTHICHSASYLIPCSWPSLHNLTFEVLSQSYIIPSYIFLRFNRGTTHDWVINFECVSYFYEFVHC